jgi:dTDP-glucose 4,6-dehydratase
VYDEAKRFAEAITLAYHRVHGSTRKIVRIFNTYGRACGCATAAPSRFMSQALRNEDVTVFGDGTQTRSFCYIERSRGRHPQADGLGHQRAVNIGNPHEVTIEQIARTIITLVGSTSRVVYRRCRRTTQSSESLTSLELGRSWAGNRVSASRTDWQKPSATSR